MPPARHRHQNRHRRCHQHGTGTSTGSGIGASPAHLNSHAKPCTYVRRRERHRAALRLPAYVVVSARPCSQIHVRKGSGHGGLSCREGG